MSNRLDLDRRSFFQTAAAAGAVSLLETGTSSVAKAATKAAAPELKFGVASYSFRKLSLDQMLAACKAAEIRYLSIKDVHLPRTSTPEVLRAAMEKCRAAGVAPLGCGVIRMKKDDPQIRRDFEYAKTCGFPLMVIAPEDGTLDTVESLVKEFGIRVAIHNHGPNDKFPTPKEAFEAVKKRDPRMGVCIDMGHTTEGGGDPVALAKVCGPRLFDVHVKDLRVKTDMNTGVPIGRGIMDIVGMMKVLRGLKFAGHVAIEYEMEPDNPIPGIVESYGYLRGLQAGLNG